MAEKIVLDCKGLRLLLLLLLYEFKKQNSARSVVDSICGTMSPTTASYDTAKVWKFKTCLEYQSRSGRPVAANEERLMELVQEDLRRCTRELTEKLGCSHTTVARGLGKTHRYGA
ncbi:unnamed protein product [Heligmosomoides polygyrus]|uniref:HTH_48 domain-containing protein n=1 Tax=Heligmosomoides polygyrus TaxID=6339 RepID=A0A183GMX9_HELPZ|nr:unnamed protein product [Heligmosomoides polygyrus]